MRRLVLAANQHERRIGAVANIMIFHRVDNSKQNVPLFSAGLTQLTHDCDMTLTNSLKMFSNSAAVCLSPSERNNREKDEIYVIFKQSLLFRSLAFNNG